MPVRGSRLAGLGLFFALGWVLGPRAEADPGVGIGEVNLSADRTVVLRVTPERAARLLIAEPPPRGFSWVLTLEEVGVDLRAQRLDEAGDSTGIWQTSPLLRKGLLHLVFAGRGGALVEPTLPEGAGEVRAQLRTVSRAAEAYGAFVAMQEGGQKAIDELEEASLAALEAYARALAIWRRIGEKRLYAEALGSRTLLLRGLGNMPAALTELEEVVGLWRELGDRARLASATNDMGLTLRDLGRPREARAALEKALEEYRFVEVPSGEAATRNNLCMLDHAAGALRQAIPCYRAALELFEDAGKPAEVATVLNNLGFAWDGLGEPAEARRAYGQALEIRRRLGDRRAEAQQLNNLGAIDRRSGDFAGALERYLQAHEIFQELGDQRRLASVLNNLGIVYFSLGDTDKARDLYESALELRRETGDRRGELITLNNLGSVLSVAGEWPRALEAHHRALEIARELGSTRLEWEASRRLGKGALRAGRPEIALEGLQRTAEALRSTEHRLSSARAEHALGEALLELARPEDSRAALDRALAGLRNLGDPVEEATVLATLARWEQSYGDLDKALAHVDEASERLDTLRARLANPRLGVGLSGHSDLWDLRIDLLMDKHRIEPRAGFDRRAFLAGEAARAQTLRRLLRAADGEPAGSVSGTSEPEPRTRRRLLAQRFAAKVDRWLRLADRPGKGEETKALERELHALEAELDRLESGSELEPSSPTPPIESLETLEGLLGPETALLSFRLGRSRSHVFRLTRHGLATFALPGRAVIEEKALRVYEDLSTIGLDRLEEAERNRAFGRILLEPVLADAADIERLAIVADGALHYLPFAALLDPRHPEDPLLDRFEIVHLPSASVLALQRARHRDRRTAPSSASDSTPWLAILADPVFQADDPRIEARPRRHGQERSAAAPSASLARLPSTRHEAEAIAALIPEKKTLLAIGPEATRERMLGAEVAGARFVHLATHGVFDARRPWVSGLTFSRFDATGAPRAGFVSLRDLDPLRWSAELVTLSACHSALGRRVRGEGVFGLTHGLLRAGAARALSSLWQVRDRSTAELMIQLYRAIWHEGLGTAAALRQAQQELRSRPRYSDPYYWSSFVLQGDWR
ncbi:MAG: CHAT domain-containing tetratricopeptide repeat protein [Holophagales bacterium]|nr:CHAT domain-containing tetratricopeptide repeat protein [Holophagales bacterium]